MSLTCELSGETLSLVAGGAPDNNSFQDADRAVVVTPSGHVCLRRLLLRKLAENGGKDPFDESRPLSEDHLVILRQASNNPPSIVPPRVATATTNGSSSTTTTATFTSTLSLLKSEYDALILELFDTRRALEETRKELSQALYQNDAAVRVVARIAMERDQAKQQLLQANVVVANDNASSSAAAAGKKRKVSELQQQQQQQQQKMEDGENDASNTDGNGNIVLPLRNDIPESDLSSMIAVWESLHKNRKSMQKQAAAVALSPSALQSLQASEKSWHKTSCSGIIAMKNNNSTNNSSSCNRLLTVGADKQAALFDLNKQVVQSNFHAPAGTAKCVDVSEEWAVIGTAQGQVHIMKLVQNAAAANGDFVQPTLEGSFSIPTPTPNNETSQQQPIVDVRLHPDNFHVVAATTSSFCLARCQKADGDAVQVVAVFEYPEDDGEKRIQHTCGALHPDGLIYVAGSAAGELLIWDLKSKTLASTLKSDGGEDDAVLAIEISNNGYHIGVSHASGIVRVWDLRKQKQVATLNSSDNDNKLESVVSVAFDDSGKYLAYCGQGSIHVATVREGKVTTVLVAPPTVSAGFSSIVWATTVVAQNEGSDSQTTTMIVASSHAQRQIYFYAATPAAAEEKAQGAAAEGSS